MFTDTRYFTVFGNAYVPERHSEGYRFGGDARAHTAPTWLVSSMLLAGISAVVAEIGFLKDYLGV